MTKIENDIHEEMKTMITDKTDCMIESYGKVLNETARMFRRSDIKNASDEEVAKRADMFWNIALQRIDNDKKDVMREAERKEEYKRRTMSMPISTMPDLPSDTMTVNMPMNMPNQKESPCAKKSREAAEKIAELEAKIIDNK